MRPPRRPRHPHGRVAAVDPLRHDLEGQTAVRPVRPLAATPYRGFLCTRLHLPAQEFPGAVTPHYSVVTHAAAPLPFEYRDGGGWRATTLTEGVTQVFDRGPHPPSRWRTDTEACCVLFDPEFLAAASSPDRGRWPELVPARVPDPQLALPVLALTAEVEQGCPNGRLYGESLALAVAVRLVRGYAAAPNEAPPAGRLSAAALRRVIELITDHLAENLSLADLAAEVGLSTFHFARLFRESTGEPPHRFQLRRRVEEAARLLRAGLHTPAEVAARVGFADQSHLSRHFKQFTGVTPGEAVRAASSSKPGRKAVQD